MNKVVLFIMLMLMPAISNAQEVIAEMDKAGLSTLNEELRQSSAGIRNLKGQIADLLPIDLSTNVTGILPAANGGISSGIIVMWSGTIATIPTGWELADGSCSITCPDLRNRFIIAADADSGGVAKSTVTGSALQTSDGVIPSHTHSVDAFVSTGIDVGAGAVPISYVSGSKSTGSYGSGTKNVAVFYALAYIIKT